MTLIAKLMLVFVLLVASLQSALAQTCNSSAMRHAQRISGEISGKHTFAAPVAGQWIFKLEPSQFGWDLRLRDPDGMDISQITPPFRMAPNPRELYGWHFRNADNSAKNTGDVNAPQHLRLFQFSPSLSGTGGFRPPSTTTDPTLLDPDPDSGRGALTITDMGLADLEPGQKARMNYLKFEVCLTWPKSEEQIIEETNANSPVFLDEEKESMYGCGLNGQQYELAAWMLPRWTGGDLDDDDAIDDVAPIIRKVDGRRGIAICRAGTRVSVVGLDEAAQQPLEPGYYSLADYLDLAEYWEMRTSDAGADMLVLGQIEKSEVGISWNVDHFSHRLLFHLVEP